MKSKISRTINSKNIVPPPPTSASLSIQLITYQWFLKRKESEIKGWQLTRDFEHWRMIMQSTYSRIIIIETDLIRIFIFVEVASYKIECTGTQAGTEFKF